MNKEQPNSILYVFYVSLVIALGGFLMGFDASVISGVIKFIEAEFRLSKIELGWAVASLSLTATLAMMTAGPLSDRFGRKNTLKCAAALFFISAIASALAPSFLALVIARMLGGLGVGAALIIAPMYIAEIGPAKYRGRMVSLNQLNIVLGISTAFFTNYLILNVINGDSEFITSPEIEQSAWRWMLGIEAIPALLYFICLFFVPESPRWLIMKGKTSQALVTLKKALGEQAAIEQLPSISKSLATGDNNSKSSILSLLKPSMRLVMVVGISIAVLQQITGINAIFFYAPMIFEQTGIGTDASFMQAILVGLTNVVFTLVAIGLIDKIGRKSLLVIGVTGISISMFTLAYQFNIATYTLTTDSLAKLTSSLDVSNLSSMIDASYSSDLTFKAALVDALGAGQAAALEAKLVAAAIQMNGTIILVSILSFVACFAVSLGPVMWVLFSELFPNKIRGIAISFVGLINSGVSFLVQLLFPWELANLGAAFTFSIYGGLAILGLGIILKYLPETKGKSLEELEVILIKK